MAKRKKRGSNSSSVFEVYGVSNLLKKLDKAGANLEEAITKAALDSAELPKRDMLSFMAKHRRTGATEESFKIYPIKWKNGVAKLKIGFDVKEGGLPAIFLNLDVVGSPKIQPKFFIDRAVDDNIDEIRRIQRNTLEEILGGLK